MAKNQLILPDTSETTNELALRNGQNLPDELVQQVLDSPGELAPAVQVRFAKRIGKPGNSRVMMMDAQTSGPAGEEHEDSESKLALRLADGTNVQLSLSFFRENQPALAGIGSGGGGRKASFAPFQSYAYEPRTYSVHERDSKLPLIMTSMAFLLGAACYGVFALQGQLNNQFVWYPKALLNKPAMTSSAPSKSVTNAKPSGTKSDGSKSAGTKSSITSSVREVIPAAPPVSAIEIISKPSVSKNFARSSRSRAKVDSNYSPRAPRGEFFVPPPPPMTFASPPPAKGFVPPPPPTPYTIPAAVPAAFDPLQALAPAVAHSNRPYTAPRKSDVVQPTPAIDKNFEKPLTQQLQLNASDKPTVQQIAPSLGERPVIQQFGDTAPSSTEFNTK